MKWDEDALREMDKVPSFVRGMARRAVEKEVRSEGRKQVTVEDVRSSREKHISFAEDQGGAKKTKIAVVRCETVSEVCPGVACFKAFNKRHRYFSEYDENTEVIGFVTCGGCPGRRVSRLADSLKKHGVDVIHLSSCMYLDDDYPACPHRDEIRKTIEAKGIKVVTGTHH
ncbi:CGGC domain-containing protein [Syntrophomonas erecta]